MEIAPSSIRILRADDFDPHLPVQKVVAALRETFQGVYEGLTVQPPQTWVTFPEGRGDLIAYLGVVSRAKAFGVKLSPYFPDRQPKVTAWTLVMSIETGEPTLLCDSYVLTSERTAGTTALALSLLLPEKGRRLGVIGVGRLGVAHLRYAMGIREWESVMVYGRNRSRVEELVSKSEQRLAIASSAESIVKESDAVLLCTSSPSAVIDYRWLRSGQFVSSITTNAPLAHEIEPEALSSCEVYCDYRATTPSVAGEMVLASKNHGWSAESIRGDLGELVAGKGVAPTGSAPVFFRSVGLGIEDIAIANVLVNTTTLPATGSAKNRKR